MAFERLTDIAWGAAARIVSGVTGKETRVEKIVEVGVFNEAEGRVVPVLHPTVILEDERGDPVVHLTGFSPTDEALRTGRSVIIQDFCPQRRVTRRLVTGE